MRKFWICIFTALLAFCLFGCEKEPETPTSVSAYKSTGSYTDITADMLSREGLDALPKKYAGMPPQEARETVVAFWRYCKTALWIPDARYDIYEDDKQNPEEQIWKRCLEQGQVFAGLPYKGSSTGSLYRLLDYMDPATGVVNVTLAGKTVGTFGGMCSSGCYWAWARVMNSCDYRWCNDSVQSRGYLRVGPYTYPDNWLRLENEGYQGTDDVCRENGEQVIYQSYAAMDIADGLIGVWEKNGHTMMCSGKPVVVYAEDGTIDGQESYMLITEQGGHWDPGVSASGIPYEYAYSLDKKFTFYKLYTGCYIPFTFGELIGTDPIEETEVTCTHSGDTITPKEIFKTSVTSNYNISDVYVLIYDAKGNEVWKHAVRARAPSTRELKISKALDVTETWGDLDSLDATKKEYTVQIEVQLGTGERPIVWQGKLAPNS